MKFLRFTLSLIITIALFMVYQFKLSDLPPIGKFFSPFIGFWQNAEAENLLPNTAFSSPFLKDKVEVVYDDRLVPHIFAQNEEDLFFTQGYVTAQNRLWQMDMQTRVAAGRLSEIIGEKVLNRDIEARRIGLKLGAERSLAFTNLNPKTKKILESYSAGVNAWITSLTPATFPMEYKLLDFEPELWSPAKAMLLLKYMANMLTGYETDFENTNAVKLLSYNVFNELFPDFPDSLLDPIIPSGTLFPERVGKLDSVGNKFLPQVAALSYPFERPEADYGSNNWAVNGSKTANGKPILCNDPHLGLNLPSIWFEVQLNAPGINVYGATIPGSPCVISGFNDSIAWGITNAAMDVKDWYNIKFRDKSRNEYEFNGKWVPSKKVVERFKVRGKETVYDTIVHTLHGPVAYDKKYNHGVETENRALKWTAHGPSNELLTLYKLNVGQNYTDYVDAIQHYVCPGQNFVFAAANNDIAIWQQGKFVDRNTQQGRFVQDGTDSSTLWKGYIPQNQNPHVLNPERGFVSSANQHPTDQSYPYYYTGIYEYFRNRRINQRLSEMSNIKAEDMMKLQNDNYNLYAEESLPLLIENLNTKGLNTSQKEILALLSGWTFYNDAELAAPIYYETWWTKFRDLLWDEFAGNNRLLTTPSAFHTIRFLKRFPSSELIDNASTPLTETLKTLATQSFVSMSKEVQQYKANHPNQEFTWANFKNTTVTHLSQQAAFSVTGVQNGGNSGIVNATSSKKGPSWRMVVSPGSKGDAYGIYPGGQSGNVGSRFYSNFIADWAKGKYYQLLLLQPNEKHPRILSTQRGTPKK